MSNCPRTGLSLPECSCKRCLEEMLHRVQPEVLGAEIRVTRSAAVDVPAAHVNRPH